MSFYTYAYGRAHTRTWRVVRSKTPLIPAETQNYKEYKELGGGEVVAKIPAVSPLIPVTSPLRWTS